MVEHYLGIVFGGILAAIATGIVVNVVRNVFRHWSGDATDAELAAIEREGAVDDADADSPLDNWTAVVLGDMNCPHAPDRRN